MEIKVIRQTPKKFSAHDNMRTRKQLPTEHNI